MKLSQSLAWFKRTKTFLRRGKKKRKENKTTFVERLLELRSQTAAEYEKKEILYNSSNGLVGLQ